MMNGQNPAEQHVNQAQQAQALAALQRLSTIMRPQEKTPILKALAEMGVDVKYMTVMIGDIPIDSVVIPLQELMLKEYQYLSGVNFDQIQEAVNDQTNPKMG